MGIAAFILAISVVIYASIKKCSVPESISEIAYIIPHWAFSMWIAFVGILVMPGMMKHLDENWQWVGFMSVVGLFCVAASSYYKTESKILHYVGGCLCAICATIVTAIINPIYMLGWMIYPAFARNKSWLFWGEVLVFTLLVIAID